MSDELRKWIEEVQQRCDAATEGPWEARHVYDLSFVEFQDVSAHGRAYKVPVAWCYWQHRTTTSEFIAHARTDLPTALSHLRDLLARAEAAEAERDRLLNAFRHTHVAGDGDEIDTCKRCGLNLRNEIHARKP